MITKLKKTKRGPYLKSILIPAFIGILIVGAISFIIISNIRINHRRAELTNRIDELRAEIMALEEENEDLNIGIIQTESDTYWEEKAREQGYQKLGEETVVVLPLEENGSGDKKDKGFWGNLFDKLGF